MALFEKRVGAPAGTIRIDTSDNTYLVTDLAPVSVTDPDDIVILASHPYVQLQGGTGGPYVGPPVVSDVYISDGVLYDSRTKAPASFSMELDYEEVTANVVGTAGGPFDVPGLVISFAEPPRPYTLEFYTPGLTNNIVNQYTYLQIFEGATALATVQNYNGGLANTGSSVVAKRRMPAPATPGIVRTFKATITGGTGATPTLVATTASPSFLRAY